MSQMWIRMELVPLPTSEFLAGLMYWNPDSGEMVGDCVGQIKALIESTVLSGLTGSLAGVELTDPMHKPTELAAILSQHYFVIPEPVADVPSFATDVSYTVN